MIERVGAVARRPGHLGRSLDQHHRHRVRQLHARCRQRHPAAKGRPHRRDRRRRRPHRLVPDRSRDVRVEARAEHPRHRRCLSRRRHSEIGVGRERARQGLRRRDRQPARRQRAGDATADRRLLQHRRARLRLFARRQLPAQGRHLCRDRGRRDQPGRCTARAARPRGGRRARNGFRPSRRTPLARSIAPYRCADRRARASRRGAGARRSRPTRSSATAFRNR